jgi:hypothetical protein
MPRPGVTREQVFEAADALAQEGIQPTAKLVRDRTGGSFSTITPHLAAWKDERGGRGVSNIPDMPEGVAGAARAMWAAAWNAAQEAIKTERDGLTAARREMEKERAEMASEIVELEAKLDTMQAERESLAATLDVAARKHKPLGSPPAPGLGSRSVTIRGASGSRSVTMGSRSLTGARQQDPRLTLSDNKASA